MKNFNTVNIGKFARIGKEEKKIIFDAINNFINRKEMFGFCKQNPSISIVGLFKPTNLVALDERFFTSEPTVSRISGYDVDCIVQDSNKINYISHYSRTGKITILSEKSNANWLKKCYERYVVKAIDGISKIRNYKDEINTLCKKIENKKYIIHKNEDENSLMLFKIDDLAEFKTELHISYRFCYVALRNASFYTYMPEMSRCAVKLGNDNANSNLLDAIIDDKSYMSNNPNEVIEIIKNECASVVEKTFSSFNIF